MAFSSKVILAKNIKLDKEYINVLNYSETSMLNLVETNAVATVNNCSFIRNTNKIQLQVLYSTALQANYVAFQNPDYSNKWFFGFIDKVEYKGNNNTEITYSVDVWSTWFSYWQVQTCFVKREHVNNDAIGANIVEENLNTGDIICDWSNIIDVQSQSFYWIVISSLFNPATGAKARGIGSYAGYPQGCLWFAWLINLENPGTDLELISDWLSNVDSLGQTNSIQSIFVLPFSAISSGQVDNTTHLVNNANFIKETTSYNKSTFYNFKDYTPKNNKLFVYPYNFLRVTNNLGGYNDYKIEDFNTIYEEQEQATVEFQFAGVPCQGFSGKLRPLFYKGVNQNDDESVQIGKFPTLSWASDSYTNWLVQNGQNIAISGITGIGQALIGNVGGVANTVANLIGGFTSAYLQANVAHGNLNMGDVSFRDSLYNLKVMRLRPKQEYLKIIDDYFTKFGYAVNELKIPNITGRTFWNYIEIGEFDILGTGSVPSEFMDTINNIARRGVTIWHNHANIGHYELDNSIN